MEVRRSNLRNQWPSSSRFSCAMDFYFRDINRNSLFNCTIFFLIHLEFVCCLIMYLNLNYLHFKYKCQCTWRSMDETWLYIVVPWKYFSWPEKKENFTGTHRFSHIFKYSVYIHVCRSYDESIWHKTTCTTGSRKYPHGYFGDPVVTGIPYYYPKVRVYEMSVFSLSYKYQCYHQAL